MMKNLADVSKYEQRIFFNSFDYILSDIDGVLRLFMDRIPGAAEGLSALRQLNKDIYFVTNNSIKPIAAHCDALSEFGVDAAHLITPAKAIMAYLKSINFNSTIYVISSEGIKRELKKAGFKIHENVTDKIEESFDQLHKVTQCDLDIGAVIIDFDYNLSYIKIQTAAEILKRDDGVLFISGVPDKVIPVSRSGAIVGQYFVYEALEQFVGRESMNFAKPAAHFIDYIKAVFKIEDGSKVLFIGDSIPQDMGFASKCGYQKLLVLSGLTTKDDLEQWNYPEEYRPQYYVDSLKNIAEILSDL